MAQQIQSRRDTAANWASADPVLAEGEAGFDLTNNQVRYGDGTSSWSELTPIAGGGGGALDDLTDVTITTPVNGNVLTYADGDWVNDTPAGGGDLLAANNLSDVASASTARTNLGLAIGTNVQAYSSVLAATTASYTTAEASKLAGIEAGADVTDTTNVTAAGALMDSEVDADIKTLSLPANTTITTFGASLVDDTSAQAALATLRVAPATVTGTTDTLAAADDATVILYTAAGAVTVTLANIATGFECVLVCLGAGGLSVAAGGMSYANSFTPKLTVSQGEALYVKQTAASTWIVLGGTAA